MGGHTCRTCKDFMLDPSRPYSGACTYWYDGSVADEDARGEALDFHSYMRVRTEDAPLTELCWEPRADDGAESEIDRLKKENAVLEDRVGDYASELEEAYGTLAEANGLLRQTQRKLEEAQLERDEVVSMLIGLHRAYAEAVGGGCDD